MADIFHKFVDFVILLVCLVNSLQINVLNIFIDYVVQINVLNIFIYYVVYL